MAEDHRHTQLEVMDSGDPDEIAPLLEDVSEIRESRGPGENGGDAEARYRKTLRRLGLLLVVLGFQQSSLRRALASWMAFLAVGVLLPVTILVISDCSGCEDGQLQSIEIGIALSQALLAAAALLCVSHILRKYSLTKFLFVDPDTRREDAEFTAKYAEQISKSTRLLLLLLLPCFLLKTAREIMRFIYVRRGSPWIFASLTVSWAYVTAIVFFAAILFHLVCSLQIIHLDEYVKRLEREVIVKELLQEHVRLRYHLSKISHRFRIYLLTQFLIVTVVQFVTLLRTMEYSGNITIFNGGDYAVSSIVQVMVIILCLNAATKISHRAQVIGALASKLHAFASCKTPPNENQNSGVGLMEFSDSFVAQLESYHERSALVMYLQANPGGITIFGWMVDRGLINTIFFLELSLVTFVLGKTVVNEGV